MLACATGKATGRGSAAGEELPPPDDKRAKTAVASKTLAFSRPSTHTASQGLSALHEHADGSQAHEEEDAQSNAHGIGVGRKLVGAIDVALKVCMVAQRGKGVGRPLNTAGPQPAGQPSSET